MSAFTSFSDSGGRCARPVDAPTEAFNRARRGSLFKALDEIERFDVSGALIIQGTGAATGANTSGGSDVDVSGRLVAAATGYTYTNPASSPINASANVDVVSVQLPTGLVLIDAVQVRAGSELSWQMLQFALVTGDVPNASGGSVQSRAVQNLSRPLARDGQIKIQKIVRGDRLLRVTATNTDIESPHLAEARITGWIIRGNAMTDDVLDDLLRTLLGVGSS